VVNGKVLLHSVAFWGPIGVWRVSPDDAWESYYHLPLGTPAELQDSFQTRARTVLDAKGYAVSKEDWLESMITRHPYEDEYELLTAPDEEPLSSVLQQIQDNSI
jgi:hypothetical protein